MVLDRLDALEKYEGIGENFPAAVAFVRNTDLKALKPGTYEIDGRKVYVMVQENHLTVHPMVFEAHAKYADIQVVLEGDEKMGWGYEGKLDPLDEAKDFRTCSEVRYETVVVHPGQFAIFLPGEMHAPGYAVEGEGDCRKLVIKVLYGEGQCPEKKKEC